MGLHFNLPGQITLDAAFAKYWLEHAQFLKSAPSVKAHIEHLLQNLGSHTLLNKIGQGELETYIATSRSETYKRTVPAGKERREGNQLFTYSPSIINRRLRTFSGMHNKARLAWNMQVQGIDFGTLRLAEPEPINNTLTEKEAQTVIDAAPLHLQHFIWFSLYTGFRKGNVLALEGTCLDMENRIITVFVKSNKPGGKRVTVPILDPLYRYIKAHELHKVEGHIITHKGNPVAREIRRSWRSALKKAGITRNVRPHDLRHTFCTWMYRETKDLLMVKEMAGHSDIKTTQRYTHTDKQAMLEKANKAFATKLRQTSLARKK